MRTISWEGVFPAMLTPFSADDVIDYAMAETNIRAQLAAGVHGLILGGSLGEASTMESSEKLELLAFTRQVAGGRVPVLLTIAEQATRVAVRLARDAEEKGADALMVLPPMRYKADDRETLEYLTAIARATALPVMIYNNPVDYKIEVTLDMFEVLAELPTVQAVKESTRDVTNIVRMRNRFADRFSLFCGIDTIVLEELMLGADGIVGGLVDAFPKETVAIYRLAKAGAYAEALEIYKWFMPLLELDIHPKLVQNIKLAAAHTGLSTEFVRAPRLPLQGEERKKVTALIRKALDSRPALPDHSRLSAAAAR